MGTAVPMNLNSCLLNFLVIALCLFSYLNFAQFISPKLAMVMKFHGWLQLGVRRAYLATICRSCLFLAQNKKIT